MRTFDAFKRYVFDTDNIEPGKGIVFAGNMFMEVSESEITESEAKLGFRFPEGLRQFYLEIGSGQLRCPASDPDGPEMANPNLLLDPSDVAGLYLKDGETLPLFPIEEDQLSKDEVVELQFEVADDGELPFFDMGDMIYLVTRPHSDDPEAVYLAHDGNQVAKDMYDLMEKLHANPNLF